jgi:DNA polymerase-3 subunit epsilon
MGRCPAPCDGRIDPERYGELVRSLISSLSTPGGLLAALEGRMNELARAERFEEAATARDRLRALAEGLARARADGWLLGSGRMVLRDGEGNRLRLSGGALIRGDGAEPLPNPCPRERADELSAVRAWIARNPVVLEEAERPAAEPVAGGAALHGLLARLRAADRPPEGASRHDR